MIASDQSNGILRTVLAIGALLLLAGGAGLLHPVSASSFTVPQIAKIVATLPASDVIPVDQHFLCLMRSDEDQGLIDGRMICYGSIKPDPPPSSPDGVFQPGVHEELTGGVGGGGLVLLNFMDCAVILPDELAVDSGFAIQLDKGGGPASGSIAIVGDTSLPLTCTDPATIGPLTLTPLALDHNEDSAESLAVLGHADPCTDRQELDDAETQGGLRDPFNPYDFYDPNGDGGIALDEVLAVAGMFGFTESHPDYDVRYDRGPSVGPTTRNSTAPDGTITMSDDVLSIAGQFGHSC